MSFNSRLSKVSIVLATLFSSQSFAGVMPTFNLTGLPQAEFRTLSEGFGAAFSNKEAEGANSLGVTGFQIGVMESTVNLNSITNAYALIAGTGASQLGNLPILKLYANKGLMDGIGVSAYYTSIPSTQMSAYGGTLHYTIKEGDFGVPALSVRASATKLFGIGTLSFSTQSAEAVLSKEFSLFTLFGGAGQVMVESTAGVNGLLVENFSMPKTFYGLKIGLGLFDLSGEYDQTGNISSTTIKLTTGF